MILHKNVGTLQNQQPGRLYFNVDSFQFCILYCDLVSNHQVQNNFVEPIPIRSFGQEFVGWVVDEVVLMNESNPFLGAADEPFTVLIFEHILDELFFASTITTTDADDIGVEFFLVCTNY